MSEQVGFALRGRNPDVLDLHRQSLERRSVHSA